MVAEKIIPLHRGVVPKARRSVALSEDDIALTFIDLEEHSLRYDHSRGAWFIWSQTHWRPDDTGEAFERIREYCATMSDNADKASDQRRLTSVKHAAAIESFAKVDRRVAVSASKWDNNPFLIATPDGTINLRTGEQREPWPDDMISRLTAVGPSDPGDECPMWLQFMNEACAGKQDQVAFLQKICGYALTGDTREHALFFIYGPGGNGKSVFLNVLTGILGDYSVTAPMEAFTTSKNDRHSTELAMMAGARLVTASETEEGKRWAEAKIKSLTGGDKISARFMRQDFFTYKPIFKLLIVGNHMPALGTVDDAAKRRFRLVPFENKPATADKELETKLRAEWPAILRWMVDGCLLWLKEGLNPPASVQAATNTYFSDQDIMQQWLDERCESDLNAQAESKMAFADWSAFASAVGEPAWSKKTFTQRLGKKGVISRSSTFEGRSARMYHGIRLKYSQSA